MVFDLPLAPSVNRYWRYTSSPRRVYLSSDAITFRRHVKAIWYGSKDRKTFTDDVRVDAWIWLPTSRSDLDNRIKATLDALEHAGVFVDDRQVARLDFRRVGVERPGRMLVEITSYPNKESI